MIKMELVIKGDYQVINFGSSVIIGEKGGKQLI